VKNAAATRGNHIFIWSGILDVATSEGEIATVVSHEMAHVLAGHTHPDPNEELRNMLIQVGAIAAGTALSAMGARYGWWIDPGELGAAAVNQIGQGILVNPYSREKELEADAVGMMLMAKAGYDPGDAVRFWSRAQRDPDFSSSLPFFATHPNAEDRVVRLHQLLPLALEGAKTARLSDGIGTKADAGPPPGAPDGPIEISQETAGLHIDPPREAAAQSADATQVKAGPHEVVASNQRQSEWRIAVDNSGVRRGRSPSARTTRRLVRDERIQVIKEEGMWLKIVSPVAGYVPRRDAEPAPELPPPL
jgi:hypothetical protein